MNKTLKNLKKYSLSGSDILECLNNQTLILTYNMLMKYNDIDEILKPFNNFVLLYKSSDDYGHFTCIMRYNNNLEFFCPYGIPLDEQQNYINNNINEKYYQNTYKLSKLFLDSPYDIIINKKKLQKMNLNNACCGRYVVLRLLFNNLNLQSFLELMKKEGNFTEDDKAVFFTEYLNNKNNN
jgi:hypothetical protein